MLTAGKKLNIIWGGSMYRKREVIKLWKSNIKLKEGLIRYNNENSNY